MTWNYQWTYQTGYESEVAVLNLPSAFRRSNVLVERFKIGADMHAGELARVERKVIPPIRNGSWSTPALPLRPNELRLLRLTPTTEPVAS